MSASYQPVNTDDDTHSPEPLPEPKKPRTFSRRIVALFLAFCFVAFASYKLGQWNVPSTVPEQASQSAAPEKPAVPSQDSASDSTGDQLEETPKPAENDTMSGKYSVGYFVNWGIYGRKYPPSLIPAQDLTHILYAFANIRQDTGEVFLSDLWADQDIHYPGDSWNDAGTNLYGNFKALYNLKQQNRHLKVLLSIGGWSYSAAFHPVVVNPTLRSKFVASAVALLENYGLDGLDVDYEYPQNEPQARGYVELLRELRAALDAHAQRKGADYRFLLTIAAPCGPDNYQKLFVREMDQSLDFWNLMAYDFSGSWDQIANHQANIHGPPISASQAVSFYTNAGVARAKLILGVPLYGRSFLNTAGPGTPFSGLGPAVGSRACMTTARCRSPARTCSTTTGCSRVGRTILRSVRWSASTTRTSEFLTHPVFNKHHSETEMLRYIHHLQSKDLSLVHAMTPLGSCTMKLNSTSSMIPLTWPEFGSVHPFAPRDQVKGYTQVIKELEDDLCKITGFHACSLQPNSGAAGEYTGLSVIRAFHEARGQKHRDVCLIPVSAHGTNPASAAMAGLKVVPVKTLQDGSLDLADLKAKAEKHKHNLAAFMITYPSTFGVFEAGVQDACKIIHDNGGQVYLDGANLNAQVGLTNPAVCGGDVCHLNLHKTFAIPHGGGGPGVGPICVAEHLASFLPSHPIIATGGKNAINAVSAAPFGSASILLISWAYIKMLGGQGLKDSSQIALLNANYMAHRLAPHYNLRYKNHNGRVAHELLIDLAEFDKAAGLKVTDFAKRLQDYGFHPPTCSWPISTCMLIEPTESESLEEIERFCDAMIHIRQEAEDIITGKQPKDSNLLKNAPHPLSVITVSDAEWNRPYSRQTAVYPVSWLREKKFWPTVSRVDDTYGDLNLVCDCPSVEETAHDFS
ncbi:hypothetical protein EWM64_g6336 [Hericium alpestre]|uniref:GH18 domain-containing protein n=1 Tax=Hericium alpestre TaxID=135208 RepID=A0A4Y9ZUE3_9AGAM|nr:hypothetical protein EWM64_g6336 [Hericium alpestre]